MYQITYNIFSHTFFLSQFLSFSHAMFSLITTSWNDRKNLWGLIRNVGGRVYIDYGGKVPEPLLKTRPIPVVQANSRYQYSPAANIQ